MKGVSELVPFAVLQEEGEPAPPEPGLVVPQGVPGEGGEDILQRPLPDLPHALGGQLVFGPQLLDVTLDFQKAGDRFDLVPELIALLPQEFLNLLGVDLLQVQPPGSPPQFMLQLFQALQFLEERRVGRGRHGFLELLLEAAHLLQKLLDPLKPLGLLGLLDPLLLQQVEGFADVVFPQHEVGELIEDLLGVSTLGRNRVLTPIITVPDHGWLS